MRPYRRLHVRLRQRRRDKLDSLLSGGIQQVRVVLRAANVRLTPKAVREIGHRYLDAGLDQALYDRQRPGAASLLDPTQSQKIVAMICADPPPGCARWTMRLIVEEAVQRKLVPKVGRETIRMLLQQHDLQPWRKKNVVRSRTRRRIHRKDGRRIGSL